MSDQSPDGSANPSADIFDVLMPLASPDDYEATVIRGQNRKRELVIRPVETSPAGLPLPNGIYYNDPACLEPIEE